MFFICGQLFVNKNIPYTSTIFVHTRQFSCKYKYMLVEYADDASASTKMEMQNKQ